MSIFSIQKHILFPVKVIKASRVRFECSLAGSDQWHHMKMRSSLQGQPHSSPFSWPLPSTSDFRAAFASGWLFLTPFRVELAISELVTANAASSMDHA